MEIKKANLYAVFMGAILCRFSNAAGRKGAVEHLFRVDANRTLHGPETGLWEVCNLFGHLDLSPVALLAKCPNSFPEANRQVPWH